jgi:hypothetical protein
MTTVRDIVARAYRKIGMSDPTGDEFRAGVDAFNDMVHGWRADGIDVWGINLALNDGLPMVGRDIGDFGDGSPIPFPEAFREGAIFMLAERLAPEFSAPVNFDANVFMRRMRAHYAADIRVSFDDALRLPQPFDIQRGVI